MPPLQIQLLKRKQRPDAPNDNMTKKDEKKKDALDGGENISRDWFENTIKKEYDKVIEKPETDPPSDNKK